MTIRKQWQVLVLIQVVYLVIASVTSVVTPIFEVYDEVWHFPLVEHLATNGLRLPEQDPAVVTQWRQQGNQPPLYYLVAAVLTSWIDTDDLDQLHRENPLPQAGIAAPDGNPNVIIHYSDLEAFPWRNTTLAVHIVRMFSVLLGAGTIIVTYYLGRELFPDQPVIALGAAALNAFLPMFILISASVSNDALSNLLSNLLLLMTVRLLKSKTLPSWRTYTYIGAIAGMGLLAKLSVGLFIPIIAVILGILSVRMRSWRPLIVGGIISGGLTILIAGWWYYRNWDLYGDPTGLNMFLEIVGKRTPQANLSQLWSERFSFLKTYWGAYGSINILLPESVYRVFNWVGGATLISSAIFVMYGLVRRRGSMEHRMIVGLVIVWPILAMIGLIQWTIQTPGSQGRLLFISLSALSIWMAVGIVWWLPLRLKPVGVTIIAAIFAVVALLAPLLLVQPAFAVPADVVPEEPATVFSNVDGPGSIALSSPTLLPSVVQPGDFVELEITWQIIEPTPNDWTLYAHLITPEGVIAGQRDVYPGRGLIATSDLHAGRAWKNPLSIPIPDTAYTPRELTAVVGWYDLSDGRRMVLPSGDTTYPVGRVALLPQESELSLPNPVSVNFGNAVELVGYELSTLSPRAGQTMEITLYWRGIRHMERDYVVFANIIDMDTLTKYADSNAMPAAWTAPTSTWVPGEIVVDVHTWTVSHEAPPDIYEVEIGLYIQDEAQTFPRLRIVPETGGLADNFLRLSPVRVVPVGEGDQVDETD